MRYLVVVVILASISYMVYRGINIKVSRDRLSSQSDREDNRIIIGGTLKIDGDYRDIIDNLDSFKNTFKGEIARKLEIDISRVIINEVQQGSIIVNFSILPEPVTNEEYPQNEIMRLFEYGNIQIGEYVTIDPISNVRRYVSELNPQVVGGMAETERILQESQCESGWGRWSECHTDNNCGEGVKTRNYVITKEGLGCPDPIPEPQTTTCSLQECPIDCEGTWSTPSPCNKECGGGVQTRVWIVNQQANSTGGSCIDPVTDLTVNEGEVRQEACNTNECPICQENWSPLNWNDAVCEAGPNSEVDVNTGNPCGTGVRRRVWETIEPEIGDNVCRGTSEDGMTTQSQSCDLSPCQVNCIGAWGEWTACSEDCVPSSSPTTSPTRSRIYNVVPGKEAAHGGNECTSPSPGEIETEECNTHSCPVDCIGSWGDWSDCGACNDSDSIIVKNRTYTVSQPLFHVTGTSPVPKDCLSEESEWDGNAPENWTQGMGLSILKDMHNIFSSTDDFHRNYSIQRDCDLPRCPINCEGSWGVWSQCSKECINDDTEDAGVQQRTYTTSVPAQYGGEQCLTTSFDSGNNWNKWVGDWGNAVGVIGSSAAIAASHDCRIGNDGSNQANCGAFSKDNIKIGGVRVDFNLGDTLTDQELTNGGGVSVERECNKHTRCSLDCDEGWGEWGDPDWSVELEGLWRSGQRFGTGAKPPRAGECKPRWWGQTRNPRTGEACGLGVQERTWLIRSQPDFGGGECAGVSPTGEFEETQSCQLDSECPVDCVTGLQPSLDICNSDIDDAGGDRGCWSDCIVPSNRCYGIRTRRVDKLVNENTTGKCPAGTYDSCSSDSDCRDFTLINHGIQEDTTVIAHNNGTEIVISLPTSYAMVAPVMLEFQHQGDTKRLQLVGDVVAGQTVLTLRQEEDSNLEGYNVSLISEQVCINGKCEMKIPGPEYEYCLTPGSQTCLNAFSEFNSLPGAEIANYPDGQGSSYECQDDPNWKGIGAESERRPDGTFFLVGGKTCYDISSISDCRNFHDTGNYNTQGVHISDACPRSCEICTHRLQRCSDLPDSQCPLNKERNSGDDEIREGGTYGEHCCDPRTNDHPSVCSCSSRSEAECLSSTLCAGHPISEMCPSRCNGFKPGLTNKQRNVGEAGVSNGTCTNSGVVRLNADCDDIEPPLDMMGSPDHLMGSKWGSLAQAFAADYAELALNADEPSPGNYIDTKLICANEHFRAQRPHYFSRFNELKCDGTSELPSNVCGEACYEDTINCYGVWDVVDGPGLSGKPVVYPNLDNNGKLICLPPIGEGNCFNSDDKILIDDILAEMAQGMTEGQAFVGGRYASIRGGGESGSGLEQNGRANLWLNNGNRNGNVNSVTATDLRDYCEAPTTGGGANCSFAGGDCGEWDSWGECDVPQNAKTGRLGWSAVAAVGDQGTCKCEPGRGGANCELKIGLGGTWRSCSDFNNNESRCTAYGCQWRGRGRCDYVNDMNLATNGGAHEGRIGTNNYGDNINGCCIDYTS